MTTDDDKQTQELTTQQRPAIGKTVRNGVSGRLKAALDDMIEQGTPWEQSAVKSNLTVRAMRLALKRPAVIRYLRDARRVWLSSATGQNLHAMARVRDQDNNQAAAVQAARSLEALASEQFGGPGAVAAGQATAGYVIDLSDERTGLSVRITSPIPRRPGDDAIDVTPNDDTPD
jgi:hypothetical protein